MSTLHRFRIRIALALPLVFGCATLGSMMKGLFNQPTLTFKDMRVKDLNFQTVTLDFTFELDNPNNVGFTLDSLDYRLAFDGKNLFEGKQDQGITVAAHGKHLVNLPFTVDFIDVTQALAALFSSRNELPYALGVGFALDTPIGPLRLPVNVEGTVPLPKLPEVRVAHVSLPQLSLTGAEVRFDLNVKNPGEFPVKLQGLGYGVELAGVAVSDGRVSIPKIAAAETVPVAVPVRLSFLHLGAAVVQAVQSKRLPYRFRGHVDVGPFQVPFDLAGRANFGARSEHP